MPENDVYFSKENMNYYLNELAKQLRKDNGKHYTAEVILVGGAAVLANYNFRSKTFDMDAYILDTASIKSAANKVGDRLGLPNGWFNADFVKTKSYSSKITAISKYYKTFAHTLQVRTLSAEYLVAMKLRAGRQYKNDLSDIKGIIDEQEAKGEPLTLQKVKDAYTMLYGSWDFLPIIPQRYIENCFSAQRSSYDQIREYEQAVHDELVWFEDTYPDQMHTENADEIIQKLSKSVQVPEEMVGEQDLINEDLNNIDIDDDFTL